MQLLELSQIIFNLTVSLAFLMIIVAAGSVAWAAWASAKAVKNLTDDIKERSADTFGKLNWILTGGSALAFITKLFRKKK